MTFQQICLPQSCNITRRLPFSPVFPPRALLSHRVRRILVWVCNFTSLLNEIFSVLLTFHDSLLAWGCHSLLAELLRKLVGSKPTASTVPLLWRQLYGTLHAIVFVKRKSEYRDFYRRFLTKRNEKDPSR